MLMRLQGLGKSFRSFQVFFNRVYSLKIGSIGFLFSVWVSKTIVAKKAAPDFTTFFLKILFSSSLFLLFKWLYTSYIQLTSHAFSSFSKRWCLRTAIKRHHDWINIKCGCFFSEYVLSLVLTVEHCFLSTTAKRSCFPDFSGEIQPLWWMDALGLYLPQIMAMKHIPKRNLNAFD